MNNTPWISMVTCAVLLGAFLLTGCSDDDGDSTTQDEGDEMVQPSALDTCAEDDFGHTPWMGPGFDAQGTLIIEPDGSYIVSATVLQIRSPEIQEEFDAAVNAMIPELMQNEGLIGASLGGSASCGTARTLTIWRDMDAMMRFVLTDSHLAGMQQTSTFARLYKTTASSIDAQEVSSVDWAMQRSMLLSVPTQGTP